MADQKQKQQAAQIIQITQDMQEFKKEPIEQETRQVSAKKRSNIDLQAVFDAVPAEQAQMLKQAAANLSGKAVEDLTVEQAMQILERGDPNPTIQATVDQIAEDAAAQISDEQWEQMAEQIQTALKSGKLQDMALSLIKQIPQITQKVQESKEDREDRPHCVASTASVAEAYRKAVADTGSMEAMTKQLKDGFAAVQKQIQKTITELIKETAPAMQDVITDITQGTTAHHTEALGVTITAITTMAQYVLKEIADFINSDTYKAIKESMATITSFLAQHREEIGSLAGTTQEIQSLAPFLEMELDELRQNPEFEDYTLSDLLEHGFDADGNPTDSPFKQVIDRAKTRQAEFETVDNTITEIEQTAKELPKLQSLIPIQHTMPNNTLMNDLAGARGTLSINAGAYDLPVIPATKRQKEITIYVMADYEPEKGIVSNLTEYERNISDAIMSIWEQAQRERKPAAFTTDSLYRAMPGRGDRASPQQKGAITKAIEKFLHLYLDIDATDELRKRKVIGPGDTYHIKDYYLRAQEHIYKAKGVQPVRAWLMTGEPLILNYAKLTGQLLTVPTRYLAIEKVKQNKASGELITMNAPRQAMTSYMLRRIAIMKHDVKRAKDALRSYNRRRNKDKTLEGRPLTAFREQSDIILFETLFKATGTTSTNRERNRRNKKFCFSVLDYWKITGYIKQYKQQTKVCSITGIIIEH